jgi:hypothetical protein
MRHRRIDTPAYLVWVEARPSMNGKGKDVYYVAVKRAAREVIQTPISSQDIEIENIYSTAVKPAERLDADNVNKPTLDALKGVAYGDDSQVRHVEATLFDRNTVDEVHGRVEHIGRLFYTTHPHVVLIRIYSDTRLAELGGAPVVQQKRYEEFERGFDAALRDATLNAAKAAEDDFIPSAGVYRELSTGHYVCPRCRSNNKRSLLVEEKTGFTCPVCTGYFLDRDRAAKADRAIAWLPINRGPHGWMAN